MIRLIRADLSRMLKTISFWICGAAAVFFTSGNFAMSLLANVDLTECFGAEMFGSGSNIFLFAAVFTALFLGTDYSDGAIRNKLAVGHRRRALYFASLAVSSVGALSYFFASRAVMLIAGLCFGGTLGISVGSFVLRLLITVFATVSACSLFTLIGMLITSKAASVVVTVIAVRVLMSASSLTAAIMSLPEYYGGADGAAELNPLYVSGVGRDILQSVCNVLPTGQAALLELSGRDLPNNAEPMPLYSVGFTASVSLIGAAIFRRKELK